VPKSTVSFFGVRDESWVVVTACLHSPRRAIAALRPKQAYDTNIMANKTQLKAAQQRMVPENENNDVQPAGLT
jgi:hypothetical protein